MISIVSVVTFTVEMRKKSDEGRAVGVNFLGTVKIVREAVNTFRAQGDPPATGYSIVT